MAALLLLANGAMALEPDENARLLAKADSVRTSDYAEFSAIVKALQERSKQLSTGQLQYLHLLEGFSRAYDGDYDGAVARLQGVIDQASDPTLRFRARAIIVNSLAVAAKYEPALSQLSELLNELPKISDKAVREQAQIVAGILYNEVGQYDLGLRYARAVLEEHHSDSGVCKAAQLRLQALAKTGKLKGNSTEFQSGIDACLKVHEALWANLIRMYQAELELTEERTDDALQLLNDHYDETVSSHYRRLVSGFDALLAQAHRRKHSPGLARQFAFAAIEAIDTRNTEPLIDAYRVLYEIAKDQGDFRSALEFHERYADAIQGYLDEMSARQLAFERVNHENIANKLQVEALNKENHVLQLQKQLSAKLVETSRLYITLLMLTLLFIGLWAYRTKRSQLHFMNLSQLDFLTGIANRPFFIEQADRALEYSRKTGQHGCLLLCDLDHFKAINDKYGHATGDEVLKRTVSACRQLLRKSDIFGRFGGEEFAVLLPGCAIDEGRRHADQLRLTIASITAHPSSAKTISASFGVTSTSNSSYELRQLLAHADAALYQAKRAGRNRVVIYGSVEEVPAGSTSSSGEWAMPGRPSVNM